MEEAIYWQKLREELLKKSLSFLACEKILTEEQEKAAALAPRADGHEYRRSA